MFVSSRRPWLILAASVALILLAYVGDGIVAGALREMRANHTGFAQLFALEAAVRLLGAACLLGLGWLLFVGPRQRLAGALMLVIGGYVALGYILWAVAGPSIALLVSARHPTVLTLWMGSGVALLGLVELVWPSSPTT